MRGYDGPIPAALGYLPANDAHPPAMIAAFGFCAEPEPGLIASDSASPIAPSGQVTGIHLTRLTSGGRKAPVEPAKIMIGPSMGQPIVLAPANDGLAIDIAEGIEKGLLIQADTGAGMWAAGCAGRMPALAAALPAYVECVTIWADRDEAGLKFARDAARVIHAKKIERTLSRPFIRKAPWFIHCLIEPKGCSTISRRRSRISGRAFSIGQLMTAR
jgi:Toprim domain-containing protein